MKKIIIISLAIYTFIATYTVQAETNISFIGEVSTSNKQIDFYTTDGGGGGKVRFAADIVTLDYAGTVIYKNVYSRIKVSQTIKDDAVLSGTVVMMDRSDEDFTLGYFVGGGVSVFAGYKHGEFEAFVTGDSANSRRARFIDEGAFAGIGYSVPVGKGALSLSLAYADMDGEIDIKEPAGSQITTGDTTGYSVSLNWNTPISDATNFAFGLNSTRYDFEDDKLGIGGFDFGTEQDFDSVSLGLVHYF